MGALMNAKKIHGLILLVGFLLFIVLPVIPSPEEKARVEKVTGTVQASTGKGAPFVAVKTGDLLPDGSVVKTGMDSRVEIRYQDHRVEVAPDTELEISSFAKEKGDVRFKLNKGFGWFHFDTGGLFSFMKEKRVYEVVTPTAVASVRGTKFSVYEGPDGMGSCVCRGEVQGQKGASSLDVKRGEIFSAPNGKKENVVDVSQYFKGKLGDPEFLQLFGEEKQKSYRKNCFFCHTESSRNSREFQDADSEYP